MIRNAREFGAAVRRARKGMGLNQAELATRCGVHVGFVVDLEGGKPTAQLDKALTVAVELGFLFPEVPGERPSSDAAPPEPDEDDDLGHLPTF